MTVQRWLYLMSCAVLALSACGGGSTPPMEDAGTTPPPPGPQAPQPPAPGVLTAVITPDSEPSLADNAVLVVKFSGAVDPATLQLGGSFTALGPVARWAAADTLHLEPPAGGWPRGQGGTLTVRATGTTGAAMAAAVSGRYFVPLQLTSGLSAIGAIGQADLATAIAQPANAGSVRSPQGSVAVAADGRIFVPDYVSHRVLGFAAVPTTSGPVANLVLGQPDYTSATAGTSAGSFTRPMQIAIDAGRMAVVDSGNSRVLLWNTVPAASGALPDVVLGQVDFASAATSCGAIGMNFPESVAITADGKLIVADTENHRVLVWRTLPTVHGTPPDLIVGQSAANRCRRNDDNQDNMADATPSARTFYRPRAVWSDGARLVVVDSDNHRVLVWNTFPASSFQPADLVLGQATFTTRAANDDNQDGVTDAASARTLNNPYNGVHSNGVQLAVADSMNNRVLVWNTFPTTSFQPADAVLGQPDFTSTAPAVAADRMNFPAGVLFHQDKLLVSDRLNHRVLVLQSP